MKIERRNKRMYTLYHNLETADSLRCDGAGIIGAVREALKMWGEEKKEIIFQVVLDKNHAIHYTEGGLINENITLVEADGRVTPRAVRNAAASVRRFLQRTKDTRGLITNASKIDAVLKNEARLKLEDQMQAVIDCLYADGEERI